MNLIWEPLIKMQQQGINLEELHYFVQNNRVSPYLELQATSLYEKNLTKETVAHIDINPYTRFAEIFDKFITADNLGYEEFNEKLADVMLHYLADLDLKLGMSKREFYIKFMIVDLERDALGCKTEFNQFSIIEKRVLVDGLLTLYETGDFIYCMIHVIHDLLPICQILIRDGEEIVFYMRETEQVAMETRINLIIKLFLPIEVKFVIHWTKTYGIVGYDETMYLEEFIL